MQPEDGRVDDDIGELEVLLEAAEQLEHGGGRGAGHAAGTDSGRGRGMRRHGI